MKNQKLAIAALIVLALAYFVGLLIYRHHRPIDADEGFYTTAARRVRSPSAAPCIEILPRRAVRWAGINSVNAASANGWESATSRGSAGSVKVLDSELRGNDG